MVADDSSILNSGETWNQLEIRMHSTLRPTFDNMKASRLKVNEDKTDYITIASHQKRLAAGGFDVETCIGGKIKKPKEYVKSLGVLISNDLTWKHQTESKLDECKKKLRGLYSIQKQVPVERRKELATGVICSRLGYALETVSTGRMKDIEALQAMKVKAGRWVMGARRLGWSTTTSFQKLGWLTIQQEVTYKTVRMAMKVIQTHQPRSLYEKITTPRLVNRAGQWHEVRERRLISEEELVKMKLSTRKSWAIRAIRWMTQIPPPLLKTCVRKNAAKKELKAWCLKHIPTTGDMILRGKSRKEEKSESYDKGDEGEDGPGEETGQKRRQQTLMQKWIQHRGREGGMGQTRGRQESLLQTPGGEKVWHEKQNVRGQNLHQHRENEEKEVRDQKAKSVDINQIQGKEKKLQVISMKKIFKSRTEKEEGNVKLVVWLIALLFLVKSRVVKTNRLEEVLKSSSIEGGLVLQCSCWGDTNAGLEDSSRTGIG